MTNVLLIVAACSIVSFVYTYADRPTPPSMDFFMALAPIIATATWLLKYLRRLRFPMPFEFAYLFSLGWIFLIPYISKRLQIPRPRRFALMLYTLIISPGLAALLATIARAFANP